MAEEVSDKPYIPVFVALLILTLSTYAVARVDLGRWNLVAAIGIASLKALLVVLYFMHVRNGNRLPQVVILAGLLWFGVLLALTMSDYVTRGW